MKNKRLAVQLNNWLNHSTPESESNTAKTSIKVGKEKENRLIRWRVEITYSLIFERNGKVLPD